MKVYSSMTELINYYNEKLTIPSRIAVTINGSVHEFKRTSTHNKDKISKGMIDTYTFIEDERCGLSIELHISYYRFFEEKRVVEAYLLFFHDEDVLYLHPLYFYDRFLRDTDYAPYINATSDALEKWTGLKWVNINKAPTAFADIRDEAYSKIKADTFYLVPPLVDPAIGSELDQSLLDLFNENYKKHWLIDEHGQSPYFNMPYEVPEFW